MKNFYFYSGQVNEKLPNILILRIEQLYLSPNTGRMMKQSQKITFPKILDVRNFCYFYDKTADYNNSSLNLSAISNNFISNNMYNNKSSIINNVSQKEDSNIPTMNTNYSSDILHNKMPTVEDLKNKCIISEVNKKYSTINECKYKLRAVCQHIGDHSSGHFVTLRKELFFDNEKEIKINELKDCNEIMNLDGELTLDGNVKGSNISINKWYRVSDNIVTPVDERYLDNCQPYLLVYDKILPT
uniref:ubiquitinyl hydrolase 1 n=1 Tax=Strongyloides stercoralis TaxID=6248 RepID=A0A0K0EAM5_STRER